MIEPNSPVLDYTGERMVPEAAETDVFWEHLYRYRFAAPLVAGQRVLDIACGEGYGAAALQKAGASQVIGVDISPEACEHAQRKYGLDARVGDAGSIPLPDAAVDVVVSFETIEHVPSPEQFLDECLRVLSPQGRLVISTPNREIYSAHGQHNPFHHRELNEAEFIGLLKPRFAKVDLFTQCPQRAPLWDARSWAAKESFWTHLRGHYRLTQLLRTSLCPHLKSEASTTYRQSAIDTILAQDRAGATLVNPYAVLKRTPYSAMQPLYFVAVAQRQNAL